MSVERLRRIVEGSTIIGYHISPLGNLGSIRENGLEAKRLPRKFTGPPNPVKKGVYFFKQSALADSLGGALEAMMWGGTKLEGGIIIVEAELDSGKIIPDGHGPEKDYTFIYPESVNSLTGIIEVAPDTVQVKHGSPSYFMVQAKHGSPSDFMVQTVNDVVEWKRPRSL
jgi:hypothetical protein